MGLGMFGDAVREAIGMWQKARGRREEAGGQGTARMNLAEMRGGKETGQVEKKQGAGKGGKVIR